MNSPVSDLVAVRFSNLKHMARSPAHYQEALRYVPETSSMRLGSLVHSLVLTNAAPRVFAGIRRGKAWDAFRQEHANEEIYTQSEYDSAKPIADAVRASPLARQFLVGEHELALNWRTLGRACRGTMDAFGPERVVELKTTKDARPEHFSRDARWRGYHAQLAWYLDGLVASGYGTASKAYIIAVESSPPYPVTVLQLTDRAISEGRRLCRLWLEQLLACEASNIWPAYCESIVEFDVPDDLELTIDGEIVEQ